jgi:hypothetical protein
MSQGDANSSEVSVARGVHRSRTSTRFALMNAWRRLSVLLVLVDLNEIRYVVGAIGLEPMTSCV